MTGKPMPEEIRLRRAVERDCETVWRWICDPAVRAAAFSSKPIPWEEHQAWFKNKIVDPASRYWLAETPDGKLVGQVRLECRDREADISIVVDEEFRGRGYGSRLLGLAGALYFAEEQGEALHAYVREDNPGSVKAFEKTGFLLADKTSVRGQPAIHLIRRR